MAHTETPPGETLERLTPREREVAQLVARGLTDRQIAEALVLSPGTATQHVKNILRKLELRRRAQVAALVSSGSGGAGPAVGQRRMAPAGSVVVTTLTIVLSVLTALYLWTTNPARPPRAVVRFDAIDASTEANGIEAGEYLHRLGMSLENVTPGTKVVLMDNRRIYGGAVVVPKGLNVLTQMGSNAPVSFTLRLSRPAGAVRFSRPRLEAGTSGVSWPEWSAHALSTGGSEIASASEGSDISYAAVPERAITFRASAGDGIAALRWDSTNHGSAFSAVLVDSLELGEKVDAFEPPERPAPVTWQSRTAMPTPRAAAASGTIHGVLYVLGGAPPGGCSSQVVEAYDPVSNGWSIKTPMTSSRSAASAAVTGGKLYVSGGWECSDANTPSSALEMFDPVSASWTARANGLVARGGAAAAAVGGKVYVAGGRGGPTVYPQLHIYDPATNTWSDAGNPMPTPRDGAVGAEIDGKFYVVGGVERTGPPNVSAGSPSAKVEIYDPATSRWLVGAPMPTPRENPAAAVLGGKLHVVGGSNERGGLDTHEVYDPASNTWAAAAPLTTPRYGAFAETVNARLYAGGGSAAGGRLLGSLEAYTGE